MTSLCFFHLPGPKSTPQSDAYPNDFAFVVPYKYIKKALDMSEKQDESIFVSYRDNAWKVSIEIFSDKMSIEVKSGKVINPEIFTTV